MQNRREFLSASAGAVLAQVLRTKADAAPWSAAGEWRNRQSGVAYRRLGRTNYMISEVVMGGNTIAPDNWEHVLEAIDMGLNYLDTAPAYGRGKSEAGYAKVLAARPRDKFFLNTKVSLWDVNRGKIYRDIFDSLAESEKKKLQREVDEEIERSGAFAPDYVCDYFAGQRPELPEATLANVMEKKYGRQIDREKNYKQIVLDSVDQSLRTMGTDHLDLLMCPHGANTAYEMLNYPEVFDAFEVLKKAGKVRYLGVSAHTNPAAILRAAVESKQYAVAMVAYNVVNHRYVDAAVEAAKKADVGVIAMKVARPVFSGGRRGSKPDDPARVKLAEEAVEGPLKVPQKAYVWALRNAAVSAVNSEMINRQLVVENLPLAFSKSQSR